MGQVLFEKRFGLGDWLMGAAAFVVASLVAVAIGFDIVQSLAIIWGFAVLVGVGFAVLGELSLRREIARLAETGDGGLEATTASLFGRGRSFTMAPGEATDWHYLPLWPGHPNWGPMQIRFTHDGNTWRIGLAEARTIDREGLRRWVPDAFADDSALREAVTPE